MTELGFDLEEVARLLRLVDERGLERLVIEEEGRRIEIEGHAAVHSHSEGPAPNGRQESAPAAPPRARRRSAERAAAREPSATHAGTVAIEAPMVGVYYRAASADAPPFVEVGDHVEVGQPIGMIEAMKVFSEIPAERAGTVVEIAVKNGDLVRQGQPLLFLSAD